MTKNKWGIEIMPNNICAIDASTNSLAFSVYNNKQLGFFGKINFTGNTTYEKVGDACIKTQALFDLYDIDAVGGSETLVDILNYVSVEIRVYP